MSAYNHQQWMKYMRRHEANVFNAFFYDKEDVMEDDIHSIIADVAAFFDLPIPEITANVNLLRRYCLVIKLMNVSFHTIWKC